MSLSNQTGIAVAAVGTEEAYDKLFRHERITRRMGDLINADSYCSSEKQINAILRTLYTYLPNPCDLTKNCFNTFYKESNGVIYRILKIFIEVAKKTVELKNKGKSFAITQKLIVNASKNVLKAEHAHEKKYKEARIIEDEEYSEITDRMLRGENCDPLESPEIPSVEREPSVRNFVKLAIRAYPNYNYTDDEVESALHKVINDVPENDCCAAVTATLVELKRREEAKIKKSEKKAKQKEAYVNLKSLKNSLPVSNDAKENS